MNAAITNAERENSARPLVTEESAVRHKANAAEWYRRYCLAARSGVGFNETGEHGEPAALWDVYLRECAMANVDPIEFAGTTADQLAKLN